MLANCTHTQTIDAGREGPHRWPVGGKLHDGVMKNDHKRVLVHPNYPNEVCLSPLDNDYETASGPVAIRRSLICLGDNPRMSGSGAT